MAAASSSVSSAPPSEDLEAATVRRILAGEFQGIGYWLLDRDAKWWNDTDDPSIAKSIAGQADDVLAAACKGSGREICSYTLGKSSTRTQGDPDCKGKFDPTNPSTWYEGCIKSRWKHYEEQYQYDGLVVIAVVTDERIPSRWPEAGVTLTHEDYGFIMEKAAQRAVILSGETIYELAHLSLHSEHGQGGGNGVTSKPYAGTVIYGAFQLDDKGRGKDESESEDESEDENEEDEEEEEEDA